MFSLIHRVVYAIWFENCGHPRVRGHPLPVSKGQTRLDGFPLHQKRPKKRLIFLYFSPSPHFLSRNRGVRVQFTLETQLTWMTITTTMCEIRIFAPEIRLNVSRWNLLLGLKSIRERTRGNFSRFMHTSFIPPFLCSIGTVVNTFSLRVY